MGKHHPLKKIYQYDLNGKFIKEWDMTLRAAEHYKVHPSNILRVLNAEMGTVAGFQWRRYKVKNIKTSKRKPTEKRVITCSIKKLREGKNLTQKKVAEALGITPSQYNFIEKGKSNFTLPTLFKAMKFFGVTFEQLFETESDEKEKVVDNQIGIQSLIKLNKMSKSNQEILASFKKANKNARERMAIRAGFASADAYRAFLEGAPVVATPKKNKSKKTGVKPLIHIVDILDRSGSMAGAKFDNALKGINDEINELKQDDSVNYTFTYVSFDDSIKTPHYKVPIGEMSSIKDRTGGTTALNQAVGQTLEKLAKNLESGAKVLVKIFTDGEENASQGKYRSSSALKTLIKECEAKGFTITFVGTKSDVAVVNRSLGIDASNSLVHDNTARGVQMSFMASTNATKMYSKKVLNNEDVLTGFYKSTDETL